MLSGNIDLQIRTLSAMDKSNICFTLTGSRFFGRETNASDWDFFTAFNVDTTEWLEKNDFTNCSMEHHSYNDQQTIGVWRLFTPEYRKERKCLPSKAHDKIASLIDVQLIMNPSLKTQVQDILKGKGIFSKYGHSFSDEAKRAIWNAMFVMADYH